MRTLLLSLVISMAFTGVYAQEPEEPHNYITKGKVLVYAYDYTHSESYPDSIFIADEAIFEMVDAEFIEDPNLGPIYIIEFWPYKATAVKNEENNIISAENTRSGEVYCIKVGDFSKVERRYKTFIYNNKLNLGTLVLPMRIRPRKAGVPMDVTNDFTLGPTVGFSFRTTRYKPSYISLILTGGLTSIQVDSLTTRGDFLQPVKLSGYTYGFGLIYEYQFIQFAVICGWDIIGGIPGKNWIYNDRNWISFGIGFQLWKSKSEESNSNKKPK